MTEVVEVTERAGLARRVAKLLPIVTIKGQGGQALGP